MTPNDEEMRLPEPKVPPPDDWDALSEFAATMYADTCDVVTWGSDCVILQQRKPPHQFTHALFETLRLRMAAPSARASGKS